MTLLQLMELSYQSRKQKQALYFQSKAKHSSYRDTLLKFKNVMRSPMAIKPMHTHI